MAAGGAALSDGYGDHEQIAEQTLDYIEGVIRSKEGLLRLQAVERRVHPNDFDDVLNEARLTLWQILTARPEVPAAYLHAATGWRITEVSSRGKWTGMASQRGKASVDPLRRADRDSLDDPDFHPEAVADDVLDRVLLAYHHGQVMQALAALPHRHREYVWLRFWGGWTSAEIAPVIGIRAGNVATMWKESIRPRLLDRLRHLEDAA